MKQWLTTEHLTSCVLLGKIVSRKKMSTETFDKKHLIKL